jgi:hypothetical protein
MTAATSDIKQMFDQLREWGAAMGVTVFRGADDEPLAAIILVDGEAATSQVLSAVEPVQAALEGRDVDAD